MPSQKKEGNLEILKMMTGASENEDEYDSGVSSSITENYFQQVETDDYFPAV